MFKKSILASVIILCSFQVNAACGLVFETSSTDVEKLMKTSKLDFKNYEQLCQKASAANANFVIQGRSVVLDNKAVAWAHISVKDRILPIASSEFSQGTTVVHGFASQDQADRMLLAAINSTFEAIEIDKVLGSLDKARKNVKMAYSK